MSVVRVKLRRNVPWYTNRDSIQGSVHLDLKQSTDVSNVVVKLCGLSRTELVRVDDNGQKFTDQEKEVVTILALEERLFPPHGEQYGEKYKLRPGVHEWPFTFQLPDRSCAKVTHSFVNYGLGQLVTGEQTLLPPSLSDLDDDVATVRYFVQVTVNRSVVLGLGPSMLCAHEPIVFLPSDPPLDHLPTFGVMHTAQSRVVSNARSVSGLISRLVSTLAHDRAQVCVNNVSFEVRCELLLTPGLKCSWLLESCVLKEDETVHISAIQIVLVARTYVRAKNLDKTVEKSTILFERLGLNIAFQAGADITALLGHPLVKVPETVPPSFAFSNVMREYRIDTRLKYSHRPSSALVHKTVLSRKVWVRAGMYALPSYDTGEILRAEREFPQSSSYYKK